MNKKIVKLAKYYVRKKDATLKSTAKKFGLSTTMVNRYLSNELKSINPKLYGKVEGKKAANILRTRDNFKKTEKVCWLIRIFKNN